MFNAPPNEAMTGQKMVWVNFENIKTGFLVTFHRLPPKAFHPSSAEEITRVKTGMITRVKTTDTLLRLISKKPSITREELAHQSGLTIKGVDWNLKKLKKDRRLKRHGSDRGGTWEIII